jgi:hypothetical protein
MQCSLIWSLNDDVSIETINHWWNVLSVMQLAYYIVFVPAINKH